MLKANENISKAKKKTYKTMPKTMETKIHNLLTAPIKLGLSDL